MATTTSSLIDVIDSNVIDLEQGGPHYMTPLLVTIFISDLHCELFVSSSLPLNWIWTLADLVWSRVWNNICPSIFKSEI